MFYFQAKREQIKALAKLPRVLFCVRIENSSNEHGEGDGHRARITDLALAQMPEAQRSRR
jgi:hypothetical protein